MGIEQTAVLKIFKVSVDMGSSKVSSNLHVMSV